MSDLFAVGQLIDDAMRPGHFFVADNLRLTWVAAKAETIRWEVFRGRLLDATQTREEKTFLSWHVIEENTDHPATEPMISVKLDVHDRRIQVTRGLLCYAQEGYDAGGGVIESREVVRWTRELVGTIELSDFDDREPLRDELICLIWQAVVGTSRLPLTSVEAPLPAFSFGKLHYVHCRDAQESSMRSWGDLLACFDQPNLSPREPAKLLEFALRTLKTGDLYRFLPNVNARLQSIALWRDLFNNVSLSPDTGFVKSVLIPLMWGVTLEMCVDVCAYILNQLNKHLSAYDLVTFHHRGANYPDALLLDEILSIYPIDSKELFQGEGPEARLRRRALRQACLLRSHYIGHFVPDAPTSPGENARVLPSSHPRVPDEQILSAHKRRRQLFENQTLVELMTDGREVLTWAISDLAHLDERVEMGLGLFIDRPLGYAKAIGEPDLTPMLAHEAFSPSIARRRWQELKKLCAELAIPCDADKLDPLFENGPWPDGLPHTEVAECPRPAAALGDVRKVADDFRILRTKPVGLRTMLEQAGILHLLPGLNPAEVRLCVQGFADAKQRVLVLFDQALQRRAELRVDVTRGYRTRAGVELPRAGLEVIKVFV